MASSYQDRLKARRGKGIEKKKPTELKLNATKRIRGKIHYWNPYTKSWSKTKVVKKVNPEKEKPLTRKQKLEKGMATWNTKKGNEAHGAELPGSKMVKKTDKPKSETETKTETKTEVKKDYKPRADATVIKDKQKKSGETLKVKPKKMHAIEKRNRKKFGDAHVDKLKAEYAKFKKKRKKK